MQSAKLTIASMRYASTRSVNMASLLATVSQASHLNALASVWFHERGWARDRMKVHRLAPGFAARGSVCEIRKAIVGGGNPFDLIFCRRGLH